MSLSTSISVLDLEIEEDLPRSGKEPMTRKCSRLKSSYEFYFEGLSNFSPSIEGPVQIQDVNPRI
jgi:hypothetical protein